MIMREILGNSDENRQETDKHTEEAAQRIARGETTIEDEFGPTTSWDQVAERMRVTPEDRTNPSIDSSTSSDTEL